MRWCSAPNEVVLKLQAEVCVVGGGPSGSALAGRLAQLGHDVVVLNSEPFPRPHIGESLPPGIIPILDQLGVRDEIESAGFLRSDGALVRWAGRSVPRSQTLAERWFQVDRGRFDLVLLQAAVSAGARLIQPVTALAPTWCAPGDWSIPLRSGDGDGPKQIKARFLVDATGRRGLLGKHKRRLTPPTLALDASWSKAAMPGAETRVEAAPDQWYWGAPLSNGTFNATVFVAPQRLRLADDMEHIYYALLASSELLSGCLSGQLRGSVRVRTAAAYVDDQPVGKDWLKVGESALALDPLSSQGVQTALISGLQGAVAVHTLLTSPQYEGPAIQFVQERNAEVARRHSELAAAFYREQAQWTPTPFWQNRAASALPSRSHLQPPIDVLPHLTDRVAVSKAISIVQTPALCGDLIRPVKAILAQGSGRPVAFLDGAPIAHLVERVDGAQTVQQVLNSWCQVQPRPIATRLLIWAIEHSVLCCVK
jgi:flavin-dependent dehydrogenase